MKELIPAALILALAGPAGAQTAAPQPVTEWTVQGYCGLGAEVAAGGPRRTTTATKTARAWVPVAIRDVLTCRSVRPEDQEAVVAEKMTHIQLRALSRENDATWFVDLDPPGATGRHNYVRITAVRVK